MFESKGIPNVPRYEAKSIRIIRSKQDWQVPPSWWNTAAQTAHEVTKPHVCNIIPSTLSCTCCIHLSPSMLVAKLYAKWIVSSSRLRMHLYHLTGAIHRQLLHHLVEDFLGFHPNRILLSMTSAINDATPYLIELFVWHQIRIGDLVAPFNINETAVPMTHGVVCEHKWGIFLFK
jgi:hypothetical protein